MAKYSPPGLNTGERTFIEHLRAFLRGPNGQALMSENRELYVLRNQSQGKGVGFQMQEDGRFFPDFVLWLLDDDLQNIIFVDPKGLNVGTGDIDADPKVQFCQNVAGYEEDLNERADRDDVRLHAFIASTTSFQTMSDKQTINTREGFADRHVCFLEDGPTAIQAMLEKGLDRAVTEDKSTASSL